MEVSVVALTLVPKDGSDFLSPFLERKHGRLWRLARVERTEARSLLLESDLFKHSGHRRPTATTHVQACLSLTLCARWLRLVSDAIGWRREGTPPFFLLRCLVLWSIFGRVVTINLPTLSVFSHPFSNRSNEYRQICALWDRNEYGLTGKHIWRTLQHTCSPKELCTLPYSQVLVLYLYVLSSSVKKSLF